MENEIKVPLRPLELHKQEKILQILLPVLFFALVVLAIIIYFIVTAGNTPQVNSTWAEISLIFLIIPFLVIGVVLAIVIFFTIWGIHKLTALLPPQFSRLEAVFNKLNYTAGVISTNSTTPFIKLRSAKAGLDMLFNLRSGKGSKTPEEK